MQWPGVRFSFSMWSFLLESRIGRLRLKGGANPTRFRDALWPIERFGFGLFLALGLCSCATVPLEPLASGEMRLLRLEPPSGEVLANIQYVYTIQFEADGRPRITRVCFYWSSDGPYCVRPKKIEYGSPGIIEVELRAKPPGTSSYGSYELETYVEYIREGKSTRTNLVGTHITVFQK